MKDITLLYALALNVGLCS